MSYSKNYICKFMQANSWHQKFVHKFSTSICPFESGKCEKEGEKYKNLKFECLENGNCFLDEKKTLLIVFEGLSFGEKRKI